MCYSAMVEQSHRKLATRYGAEVDLDSYEDLFHRRWEGEKLAIPRGVEVAFTTNAQCKQEQGIAMLIREWHEEQINTREDDLSKQSIRLAEAERRLKIRETKKATNDKRIALQKIPWLEEKISWHQQTKTRDEDYRIYPQNYVSLVYTDAAGNLKVGPFRYHMRPAWADEKWDAQRGGSYNARRDSLQSVWKNQFGKHHGLLTVKHFFENVTPARYRAKPQLAADLSKRDRIVIRFEPDDHQYMEIPTIFDIWVQKGKPALYSTALITDDPLAEIAAAGHDRTPVSLKRSAARQWLDPKSRERSELFALLDDIKRPHYTHQVAA